MLGYFKFNFNDSLTSLYTPSKELIKAENVYNGANNSQTQFIIVQGKNRKTITAVLLVRLILLPLVTVPLGYALGLRGVELFLVLMIFGTPIATASYPMAENMGGDGQLAGQLVFTSTVASLGTIFLFIYAMSRLGLLVS